jgi:hypothetical protein
MLGLRKRPTIKDDIDALSVKLGQIRDLKHLTEQHGWKSVDAIFRAYVAQNLQDVYNLSIDPIKNDRLIREKRAVSEALTQILSTIDSRIREEGSTIKTIDEKRQFLANLINQSE